MNKVLTECKRLITANALHRKGFRIGDRTPREHLMYADGELTELYGAELDMIGFSKGIVGGEAGEDRYFAHSLEELADTINCLMFYAASKGFTLSQIEAACLRKLSLRLKEDKDAADH